MLGNLSYYIQPLSICGSPVDVRKNVRYNVAKGDDGMKVVNATNARNDLYNLIDQTITSSEPIQITSRRGNAILLSEEDWKSIQESLYLLSIPGMKESIIEGINAPVEECEDVESLGWDLN